MVEPFKTLTMEKNDGTLLVDEIRADGWTGLPSLVQRDRLPCGGGHLERTGVQPDRRCHKTLQPDFPLAFQSHPILFQRCCQSHQDDSARVGDEK